ncbi:hypothetical protein M9Y10_039056 [Tritrichomonas musculus]|uniref:Ankyrin repeat protein n=1 Tax=Tritrichomonas musculus TaxID=1915356 RepID=A0ABR2KA59_9EUKA
MTLISQSNYKINDKTFHEIPQLNNFMEFNESIFNVTAIHLAAQNSHQDIIKLLLSQEGIQIGNFVFNECSEEGIAILL